MWLVLLTLWLGGAHAGPIAFVGETFHDWKERLFGKGHPLPEVVDAPATGAITLVPGQPLRIRIDAQAPQRDLAKGHSHYREVVLPQALAHASLRVQVVTQRQRKVGNTVFQPVLYLQGEDGALREPLVVKPLHLDIRPFRKSRLLGCVRLDDVRGFLLATDASVVGKSWEAQVREAIKAPSASGFYYATDAIKARLPFAATGQVILDISAEDDAGPTC
ncbi:MAG: hypothetical protein F9K31_03780 [Dokdonella sp.]|nr:MAG: hypothetical protein F9K31_03780 [Dokdonella sp.]